MVACAESHFGIYHYVIWQTGYVGVKRAVYHTLIINDDRFEIIFLPFRIPIPALDCRPSDFNRGFKREIGYYFLEHRFSVYVPPACSECPHPSSYCYYVSPKEEK